MRIYDIVAGAKIFLWLLIIFVTYHYINVYEDPLVAFGLGLLGMFILSWGASFYLFVLIQKWFRTLQTRDIMKDSYKLSLLFGIYVIFNVLLILLGYRNKFVWLILLVGFILLQVFLFSSLRDSHEPKYRE